MSQRRALLSVSDKTGIENLGRTLAEKGWRILSTGGTAQTLREAGVPVVEVSEETGHPEMMDGRVKTLHPAIHAGLLARRDHEVDLEDLAAMGYAPIDLVVVNLYPFRETISRGVVTTAEAMEQVDIGGPTMIRSAAKNHRDVWVVVDPADYGAVCDALDDESESTADLRRALAAKVFRHVSGYDEAVAGFLENGSGESTASAPAGPGNSVGMGASEVEEGFRVECGSGKSLRYGENPDQRATFYAEAGGAPQGLADLVQHQGKELSYNNYMDLDGALLALAPFAFSRRAAVCIVKHTTPCGLAVADSLHGAYQRALRTDPVSAFGSVIAVNRSVDGATAEAMRSLFVECVVAPGFTEEALEVLGAKKNLRLLSFGGVEGALPWEPTGAEVDALPASELGAARWIASHGRRPRERAYRSVYGGALVQTPPMPPFYGVEGTEWKVATERAPSDEEWDDLRFAWAAVFSVKSNAILLAKDGATLGIGAGQMSRVDSSRIAVMKAADAGLDLGGAVLASDAFFPFRDGVDAAAEAGVRAIVQPGGSIRDDEVTAAADEHGITMVLTGRRLFRH